mmetsp:Transcript_58414/g.49295  ORF Transcript_58414/g.49295 Transcript_58414/m.49295 type:complete len:86 (-) Transcript_58414:1271-1528(-)
MTSSRSHCIYSLTLIQKQKNNSKDVTMTKLRFVDLAGSEKIPKVFHKTDSKSDLMSSTRLNELIGINKSLTALGHCINSLSKAQM